MKPFRLFLQNEDKKKLPNIEMNNRAWEISYMEIKNHKGRKYKVTRRLPLFAIAETKIFRSKRQAKKQLQE